MEEQTQRVRLHKERVGTVVSDIQDKTVIVRVDRKTSHLKYGKVIVRTKKFYVHDQNNQAHLGDQVRIIETRPLSKLKRWRLAEVLK